MKKQRNLVKVAEGFQEDPTSSALWLCIEKGDPIPKPVKPYSRVDALAYDITQLEADQNLSWGLVYEVDRFGKLCNRQINGTCPFSGEECPLRQCLSEKNWLDVIEEKRTISLKQSEFMFNYAINRAMEELEVNGEEGRAADKAIRELWGIIYSTIAEQTQFKESDIASEVDIRLLVSRFKEYQGDKMLNHTGKTLAIIGRILSITLEKLASK